ncbi:MAG: hypothetical protein AAFQ98_25725, partial [Bacteroidota bacterium]
MRTILTIVFSAALFYPLFGQSINDLTRPTEAHVQITGTSIYLVPPAGFSPSSEFKGFQNEAEPFSSVLVVEVPAPFDGIIEGFSPDNPQSKAGLKQQNMTLISSTFSQVGGKEALWVELEQEAYGYTFAKSILVVNLDPATVMINATALKDNPEAYAEVVKSIRSFVLTNETIEDPRASLPYTIDETAGNLKFIQVVSNGTLLSRDGKIPSSEKDHPLFITVDRAMNQANVSNPKQTFLQRVTQLPGGYQQPNEADIKSITVDGIKGYQASLVSPEKPE